MDSGEHGAARTPRIVYIGQDGALWRLTLDEWIAICRAGAAGEGYDLGGYRELKQPPRGVLKSRSGQVGHDGYYCQRNDVLYFEPLFWQEDEFRHWLERHVDFVSSLSSRVEMASNQP